jgi:uncharacterized membrane protein YfcA
MPVAAAVGTASSFSFVYKIGAGWSHQRDGNVAWPLLLDFLKPGLTICVISALAVVWMLGMQGQWATSLAQALEMATFLAGLIALLSMHTGSALRLLKRAGLRTLACTTGALVGATGTGGGILVTPALLAASDESPQRIVGTSISIGLALSAATALIFGASGNVDPQVLGWMLAGALATMPMARAAFARLSPEGIRRLTSVAVVAALLALAPKLVLHLAAFREILTR